MNALLLGLIVAAQVAAPTTDPPSDAGPAALSLDAGDAVATATDAGPASPVETGAAADAGAVGDAGVTLDAGAVPVPELAREVATVRERPSPLVFRLALGGRDARARASATSAALAAAIDAPAVDGAPFVRVYVDGATALVTVRGRAVTTVSDDDAAAEGLDLERYAAILETRLHSFVDEELRRASLQALALRVFLAVLFALIGVLTLRALRRAFARWERALEESSPSPLQLFGAPILSSDAKKATLLLGLATGRVLAFIGVVVVVVGAVFGQFEATRPLLARAGAAAAAPLVRGADALVRAVPGILLAIGLVLAARALLRFAELLLDGVAQGRVPSRVIGPRRVRPVRAIVLIGIALLAAPLVAGAAFGRFGTPLETLALVASGAVFFAAVPALASLAAGIVVVWRGTLQPGDWVEVAGVRGEVSALQLFDVILVPETGGTVSLPMLALVVLPTRRTSAPSVELQVVVVRDKPLQAIEDALARVVKSVDAAGEVELVDATGRHLRCVLRVPLGKATARSALVRGIVVAAERHELTLDAGSDAPAPHAVSTT